MSGLIERPSLSEARSPDSSDDRSTVPHSLPPTFEHHSRLTSSDDVTLLEDEKKARRGQRQSSHTPRVRALSMNDAGMNFANVTIGDILRARKTLTRMSQAQNNMPNPDEEPSKSSKKRVTFDLGDDEDKDPKNQSEIFNEIAKPPEKKKRWTHTYRENMLRRIWGTPVLRQDWGDLQESSKIDWFEVFYDLIYVAVAIKLADFIKADKSVNGLTLAFLYYASFWETWTHLTMYWTRFLNEDVFSTLMMWVHSLAVLGMGVNLTTSDGDRHRFVEAMILNKVSLILLYVQVALKVKRARAYATATVCAFSLATLLWLISIFLPRVAADTFGLLAVMIGIFKEALIFRLEGARLPLNVEHTAERVGLFIMLILGESVISLVVPPLVPDADHYWVVILGFVIVFSLKQGYFNAQPHEADQHALRHSRASGRLYFFSHLPLGAALLTTGVGLKMCLLHATEKKVKSADIKMLCFSVAISEVFMNLVRLAHPFRKRILSVWLFRGVIVLLLFCMPFYATNLSTVGVVGVVAMLFCMLAVDDWLGGEVHEEEMDLADELGAEESVVRLRAITESDSDSYSDSGESEDEAGPSMYNDEDLIAQQERELEMENAQEQGIESNKVYADAQLELPSMTPEEMERGDRRDSALSSRSHQSNGSNQFSLETVREAGARTFEMGLNHRRSRRHHHGHGHGHHHRRHHHHRHGHRRLRSISVGGHAAPDTSLAARLRMQAPILTPRSLHRSRQEALHDEFYL